MLGPSYLASSELLDPPEALEVGVAQVVDHHDVMAFGQQLQYLH